MANPDFKNMHFKDIEFAYVHLDQPTVFDMSENASKKVDPSHPGAKYSLTFTLSAEDGEKFASDCLQHFNERKAESKKISTAFGAVHGMKIRDDGLYQVTASRKCVNAGGQQSAEIPVIDANGDAVANRGFMGGSRGTVLFSVYPAPNPSSGKWGVSLGLLKVQLLKRGAGGGDDAGIFDVAERDEVFGLPPVAAPVSASTSSNTNVLDDDIPF